MKYYLYVVFLIMLLIPVESCSRVDNVTSPELSNNIAKRNNSFDLSQDTLVILPRSNKSMLINKNFGPLQFKQLDDYLVTHKISDGNLRAAKLLCNLYITYTYELANQYEPVDGKYLGISNDLHLITDYAAKNTYGFSLIAANGFSDIINDTTAGYLPSNIMVDYLNPTEALNTLKSDPNGYPRCGYYEIDEPTEHYDSPTDTKSLETLINSWNIGAKVMLTSFHWPSPSLCNLNVNWGATIGTYEGSNYYIMCDQYDGDACGSECDYWDEYSNYFNPSHVISNWVKNQMWYTSAWDCAFKLANGSDQNITQIWLYAGTGDTTSILGFCYYAWMNGWLVRQLKQVEQVWECDANNPCSNCSYPNSFYLSYSFYTGKEEYTNYIP